MVGPIAHWTSKLRLCRAGQKGGWARDLQQVGDGDENLRKRRERKLRVEGHMLTTVGPAYQIGVKLKFKDFS